MHEKDSDFQDPRLLVTEHVPWLYRDPKIAHYYGDFVRQCLVAAAALMLLTAPYYADDLHNELPFEIIGAVVLVALAALTSPWNRTVIIGDAVASGAGLVVFELWALQEYSPSLLIAFALRQAIAIAFMCAFYFSMKTFRAMMFRQIGQPNPIAADIEPEEPEEEVDEFKEPANEKEAEELAERRKVWHDKAIHERREYDG